MEKHELLEMRRIAALLYKNNKRFKQAIELSKQDSVWKDCMTTARDSGSQELAEDLLKFFVESGDGECFAACLYTCYELIRPDIALEYAWRHRMMDYVMPYMIQTMREYTTRLDKLDKKTKKKEEEDEKEKSAANDLLVSQNMMGMPGSNLAIGNGNAMHQSMGGGMQMGGMGMGGMGGMGMGMMPN